MCNNNVQKGIALIQVLIISFILALLGIFINQSVQQQVKITERIQTKFQLRLELEEAETQLFEVLLSNSKYSNQQSDNPIVKKWNFYGKEFQLTDTTFVTLTDMRSLISLNFPNRRLMKQFLLYSEVNEQTAEVFISSLYDWLDENDFRLLNGAESDYYRQLNKGYTARNNYLQSVSEAKLIRGAEHIPLDLFEQYFTTEFVSGFNPINAPDSILKAFLNDDDIAEKVLQRRNNNTLTNFDFYQLTSIEEDEAITFGTSNKIRVQLRTVSADAQLIKQYILDASPRTYSKPIAFYKVSWNKP